MKKIATTMLLMAFMAMLLPTVALADNFTAGVVTIDTSWNGNPTNASETLEEAILNTGATATDVIELHITADDTLGSLDQVYIASSLPSMTVFSSGISTLFDGDDDTFTGDIIASFFRNNTTIESVSMDTAVFFRNFAFTTTNSLEYVDLPSAIEFRSNAFNVATSLTTVILPNATTFGGGAFGACTSLSTIDLPEAITFGSGAFADCTFTTITLPKATTFGNASFYDCPFLMTINLPEATTFGNGVFSYCPALTTINTPKATAFGIETLLGSPQPVMLTLGNTIPTVNGFGAGIPVTGSQLYVPYGRIVSYDADLSGAGDIDGDGLWYGWPLNELPAPAVNPQTGDDSSIIWIIATLVIVLLAIIDIIILKKYTNL